MSFVLRIDADCQRLVAITADRAGHIDHVDLERLHNEGCPTSKSRKRWRIQLDTSTLRSTSPEEYLHAHGFSNLSTSHEIKHLVFEVTLASQRYVFPALVLMRTMMAPAKLMLADMFRPQALDQLCRIVRTGAYPTVKIDAGWSTESNALRYTSWQRRLEWMLAYPSARRMADSAHRYAMNGELAISIPLGTAQMAVAGLEHCGTVYVTEATLLSFSPVEEPSLNLPAVSSEIVFDTRAPQTSTRQPLRAQIPTHRDGGVDLTDVEWQYVESLLRQGRKIKRKCELCQRALFDGVLRKLSRGVGWRDSAYAVGDWQNASFAYRTWVRSGAMAEALKFLNGSRDEPA